MAKATFEPFLPPRDELITVLGEENTERLLGTHVLNDVAEIIGRDAARTIREAIVTRSGNRLSIQDVRNSLENHMAELMLGRPLQNSTPASRQTERARQSREFMRDVIATLQKHGWKIVGKKPSSSGMVDDVRHIDPPDHMSANGTTSEREFRSLIAEVQNFSTWRVNTTLNRWVPATGMDVLLDMMREESLAVAREEERRKAGGGSGPPPLPN
jgi:hypothetical protein